MGCIYSIQICEIFHQTFGPGLRKCPMCPMIFMDTDRTVRDGTLTGFPHSGTIFSLEISLAHDDVIKWEHFPHYWPFVREVTGGFPAKDQWRGALMFSLMCAWMNGWVNNREAGDLRFSNSITVDHIATKFGTCHDSPAVVPCAKFCSDSCISTWMRAKWNFHHIWIVMEKLLVKWAPELTRYCDVQWPIFPMVSMDTVTWHWGRRVMEIVIICRAVNCLAGAVIILHIMVK